MGVRTPGLPEAAVEEETAVQRRQTGNLQLEWNNLRWFATRSSCSGPGVPEKSNEKQHEWLKNNNNSTWRHHAGNLKLQERQILHHFYENYTGTSRRKAGLVWFNRARRKPTHKKVIPSIKLKAWSPFEPATVYLFSKILTNHLINTCWSSRDYRWKWAWTEQ